VTLGESRTASLHAGEAPSPEQRGCAQPCLHTPPDKRIPATRPSISCPHGLADNPPTTRAATANRTAPGWKSVREPPRRIGSRSRQPMSSSNSPAPTAVSSSGSTPTPAPTATVTKPTSSRCSPESGNNRSAGSCSGIWLAFTRKCHSTARRPRAPENPTIPPDSRREEPTRRPTLAILPVVET
jgi:hypothetical protein